MIVTKDLDRKLYDYIDPWGGNLALVDSSIREYYCRTLGFMPGRAVFGINILFNITTLIDFIFVITRNQRQVDIDDARKNSGRFRDDYALGDLVYLENTGI